MTSSSEEKGASTQHGFSAAKRCVEKVAVGYRGSARVRVGEERERPLNGSTTVSHHRQSPRAIEAIDLAFIRVLDKYTYLGHSFLKNFIRLQCATREELSNGRGSDHWFLLGS